MCEWLASREWCDVQLLCGGRAFSAHRAVLASASAYLRQILLSCPTEEASTFIVLPEFDIEAMSSVLYYIYNGEVVIQKQKLGMFLDIVKAMQIFVDSQYLARSDIEHADFNKCLDRVCIQSGASALFCLESETRNGKNYVNIKKGEALQDILRRCSFSEGILDWLKPREGLESDDKSAFEVFSQFGDRQSSALLRELFIETYPEYGNANGRSAGVLEITNERYRGPTSVLLTNANGSHPGAGCARGAPTTSHSSNGPPYIKNECHAVAYGNLNIEKTMKQRSTKSILERCRSAESNGMTTLNPFPFAPYLDLRMAALLDSDSDLVLKQNENVPLISSTNYKSSVKHKDILSTKHKGKKNTILNHVLESPWCPRIPKPYLKPYFCKNVKRNPDLFENTDMPMEEKPDNDRNNNVSLVSNAEVKDSLSVKQESTSSNFEDYSCNVCDQVFPSAEALSTHARRHTTPSRYSCTECSKTFSQLRNFKYHMSVHRGTREFAATCPVCGKYFNDRGYLSSHMKIHRNRKEYKCSLCPKSFNQRVAYNMHVRIHTGVKPHVCAECGKAFSRKMLLKQHQRTHSGERPYGCAHCGKRFADRSNMTLHLRLHSGVKPFSCSLCPKSFTKKHHLKSHLNFHTGVKPYSCPRCRLAFTQSSNMRTHLKKCNAPTPPSQLVDNTSIEPVLGKEDPDSVVPTDP